MLLKRPVDGAGGVVVFSHRELPMFAALSETHDSVWSAFTRQNIVSVHFGFHHRYARVPKMVDIVFAARGTVPSRVSGALGRTFYCSRDFVGGEFSPNLRARNWDYLSVSRVNVSKRQGHELRVLRVLTKTHPKSRFCVVLPSPPRGSKARAEHDAVIESYAAIGFTLNDPASRLAVLEGSEDRYPMNFSRYEIASLMRDSRIYVHWARREGESRTIAEATRSGCFILADKRLKGGGLETVSPNNSALFRNLNDAERKFSELLETELCPTYDLPSLQENIEGLKGEIQSLAGASEKLGGGAWLTEELDFRLPSHGCPANWGREFETPELGTDEGWSWLHEVGLLREDLAGSVSAEPRVSVAQRLWRAGLRVSRRIRRTEVGGG